MILMARGERLECPVWSENTIVFGNQKANCMSKSLYTGKSLYNQKEFARRERGGEKKKLTTLLSFWVSNTAFHYFSRV